MQNSKPRRSGSGSGQGYRGSRPNNGPRHNQSRRPHPNDMANAKRSYERYIALARAASLAGDVVEMENCYQHAEHYFRMMREQNA
jgi:hypothetical protein